MSEQTRRHLLGVGDLTRADAERLLDTARALERSLEREVKKLPTLRGRLVVRPDPPSTRESRCAIRR